ncbi:MAG TPA: adenosylcobalamin-dependent ribonucleoside-diphosphate reductase [Syntrophales bacterium]|nr:adenosylcobalamin-dependent ribonucleoside-diphosphate reductase [Syntrophales bacterium]HPI56052.1 adenosylcobalamin-dependent ribonucleoside-diphosphate reductase [Syntrophales bacterium]HPN24058.1 adenosylcobalamin-dependent ribonucleoside-diphosphate reductase [Syntrophales bacterium]HQM28337.1 adenosylcobalamin-dependent ribonucleoside-diphosphate reductase [Syntrophales bacterium]
MKKFIPPRKVKKRDGSVVPFDRGKIENAIYRAAMEVLQEKGRAAFVSGIVTEIVLNEISAQYGGRQIDVESIQDIVERGLMKAGYTEIARSYILYRERRAEIRTAKAALGLRDDLKLSINAMEVLKKRYLLKDDDQNVVEAPGELFRRVARHIAQAEKAFRGSPSVGEAEEKFLSMMRSLEFIPNSPTLMNAGTSLGQLSACFVIPVEDSIDGIFDALEDMAKIHQTGGGTGFSFSRLRPKGDLVSTTKGEASGPVSFMSIFDRATGVIVQGGRRRGANMGILRCDHPDVIDFIEAKMERRRFTNFNLSVGITDRFMKALLKNGPFDLVNPRTKQKVRTLKARAVFDLIVNAAWRTGDPGLIFLDEINRKNPTPGIGTIEATNPCGELPLLPFESCNLGSINLEKMVSGGRLDWERLRDRVRWGIRFLDNVIEVNRFPLPQIREITFANRKIGLGVMGFADMLISLGIPYNSLEAVRFARRLMRFIRDESLKASAELAEERGVFPNFDQSVYAPKNLRLRNATVNTVAPTGTISIIAGCSSGIEPLFAVSFVRNVLSGTRLFETNPIFEEMARSRGIYSREIIAEIARAGSLRTVRAVPADLRRLFVTAFDVSPQEHLDIQSAFQAYTDNSVSKTINLPADSTVEDVRSIYLRAYRLKCKGITVYRYGSREEQVLSFYSAKEARESRDIEFVSADSDYSGGCAAGTCTF